MNIKIRYQLMYNLHKSHCVHILTTNTGYVPRKGDIVNLNGDPFIVYDVGNAETDDFEESYGQESSVYVDVFKAGSYKLTIGGKKY